MFGIYLKTSLRHLSRSRLYAIINITGLATGITAMLLAILFWRSEASFDKFHTNAENLYRVTTTLIEERDGDKVTTGGTGQVQGPAFKAAIPEIKSFTRVMGGDIYSTANANNKTIKIQPLFVDANFLQVFTFPLINGDLSTALADVSSLVLTESTARKFFNSVEVIGKTVVLDADPSFERLAKPLIVTAVVKDPPQHSSLQFDALYSFAFMQLSFDDKAWLNAYLGTFLLLHPGSDVTKVTDKFRDLYRAHASTQLADAIRNFRFDPQISYGLQRIDEIHLDPLIRTTGNAENGVINGSRPVYTIIFLGIAGFILLMAAVNFININLAGSIRRSKEVGIRKIAGGTRLQVITQFIVEACLLCVVAFILSLLLLQLLLPSFNEVTGKHLTGADLWSSSVLFYFALLMLILVAITSLYPAFILSRFKPAEVLYSRMTTGRSNTFGKLLVIVQFTPAIFLLIATIVYYSQMNYMRSRDQGFDSSHVVTSSVYGNRDYAAVIRQLSKALKNEPAVEMFSFGSSGYERRIKVNGNQLMIFKKSADENHLPLLNIKLLAGRNFVPADADKGIIVNEEFVRAAGLDYAIGSPVRINDDGDDIDRSIVGVVKDYHYASPRVPIRPMVIFMKKEPDGDIWLKAEPSGMKKAIAALESAYKKAMPGALFSYALMDESKAAEFVQEERWQKVVTAGTVLAFIICWLGLFGLAHLSTYQRIKEIGIRKVLGASVSQIVALLTGNFMKLVVIAIAIASPLAWLAMNYWLRNYAYHIDIGPVTFIIASAMAVTVTFASVSYQSFRSALMNPVKSLRTE